ncbi:molybdopterin molybdotransferase MoeA [Marinibaculum pumilum]|uniref:Molybdopterin molybdenumtransferase n=1 Tax=Marinibaculum pumilum TaxID=1766165 RepID=A0ABV7KV83_9PROT
MAPVPVDTAFEAALALASPVEGTERVALPAAPGRILATDSPAAGPYPAFDHAAVDGYALRAADGAEAPVVLPCTDLSLPGSRPAPLAPGRAARIFTGAPIPDGADSVVMQEACAAVTLPDGTPAVRIGTAAAAGGNLRRAGEDMRPGEALLTAGSLLDARHLAAAAAADIGALEVRRRVRVAYLSCGNELLPPGAPAAAGIPAARDSNRPMLAALLARPWIEARDLGIQPDQPERLQAALAEAAGWADLVVTSGGMSVGETDHLPEAVARLEGEWAALQVAMKPGKPLGLGRLGAAVLLGLPGNPYAAFVGAVLFGGLVLRRLSGQPAVRPPGRRALLAEAVSRRPGRTDFLPVALVPAQGEGPPRLQVLGPGGSARLAPLLAADGLAEVAGDLAAAPAGTPVRFHSFAELFGTG